MIQATPDRQLMGGQRDTMDYSVMKDLNETEELEQIGHNLTSFMKQRERQSLPVN
jgi:hypothetical protein